VPDTIAIANTPDARRSHPLARSRELALRWWVSGPTPGHGPIFVSVTDFHVPRAADLLRVYVEGLRLRRAWASMPGAVGMWLWSKPLRRRAGSVSVWREERDLRRFVLWARHRELMRRYRDAGELSSFGWLEERFDSERVWRKAASRLVDGDRARSAREEER
jgi:hypothetical protein